MINNNKSFIIGEIGINHNGDLRLAKKIIFDLNLFKIWFTSLVWQLKYFILLLSIVFLASTLLSLYHLGIEQGFIEESLVCDLQNSSKILSKEEILKQLQEKRVSCKDVTFKIFGLSLTTLNIIISILITIVLTKIYLSYEKNK